MIIDKDYDAALWYIVKADKKIRKVISNFIEELPEKFLENIRVAVEKTKKGELDKEIDEFYRCDSEIDPKITYYFRIDDEKALSILKTYDDGVHENDLFELMIYPMSIDKAKALDYFDDEWIGTITSNIKEKYVNDNMSLIYCDENEYNLYNTPICHFVGFNREIFDGKREISLYKPINLRSMPEDINKDNILCKKLGFKK